METFCIPKSVKFPITHLNQNNFQFLALDIKNQSVLIFPFPTTAYKSYLKLENEDSIICNAYISLAMNICMRKKLSLC